LGYFSFRVRKLLAAAMLAGCVAPANAASFRSAQICQGTIPDRHRAAKVIVVGNRITFSSDGGAGQIIRGFNFRALITDHRRAYDQANSSAKDAKFYRQSYDADLRFGTDEIAAMKRWGANTARFQVSQHDMEISDPGYVACLTNAVRAVRNTGMLVVLAMQWQKNLKGDAYGLMLPTAATEMAWKHVDALFHDDPGIIYDVYNEPSPRIYSDVDRLRLSPDAAQLWRRWLYGDGKGSAGYIGHQALISWMRSRQGLGTDKVLLVEPLDLGRSYEGMPLVNGAPPIDDPAHRLVYALHPYPHGRIGSSTAIQDELYDKRWGYLKRLGVPVMITEWSENGRALDGMPAARAADLVNYVNNNAIPLVASAFDVNGMFVKNLNITPGPQPRQPTNFDKYVPSKHAGGAGPGILLCRFFRRGYRPSFTYTSADLETPLVAGEDDSSPCQDRAAGSPRRHPKTAAN